MPPRRHRGFRKKNDQIPGCGNSYLLNQSANAALHDAVLSSGGHSCPGRFQNRRRRAATAWVNFQATKQSQATTAFAPTE
jgi:hypothetical protein